MAAANRAIASAISPAVQLVWKVSSVVMENKESVERRVSMEKRVFLVQKVLLVLLVLQVPADLVEFLVSLLPLERQGLLEAMVWMETLVSKAHKVRMVQMAIEARKE